MKEFKDVDQLKEMISEHERLIKVLTSGEKIETELKIQLAELEKYKKQLKELEGKEESLSKISKAFLEGEVDEDTLSKGIVSFNEVYEEFKKGLSNSIAIIKSKAEKKNKSEVDYLDWHNKVDEQCEFCEYWIKSDSCWKVNGDISSEGHCKLFEHGEIVKARSGIYEDTLENRKLGRVGVKYGNVSSEENNRGGVYNSPEYKLAKTVRSILESRGVNINFNISNTDFGNSMYFTVFGENLTSPKLKVRISDHHVTNFDRVFGEQHESASSDPERIANDIELAMYPDRYDKKEVGKRYISNYDNKILSEGEVDKESNSAWIEGKQEMTPKQLLEFEENENHKVLEKVFLRESKSGNKIYSVKFKRRHSVNSEPVFRYFRKVKDIEKGILGDGALIDFDNLLKGKNAQLGETREWQGRKMVKTAQGWVPANQKQAKKQDDSKGSKPAKGGEGERQQHSPEKLAEFAKEAPEGGLQSAIKNSPDPEVRAAAHAELDRRQKEEKSQEDGEKSAQLDNTKEQEGTFDTKEGIEGEIRRLRSIDTDDLDEITAISDKVQELLKKRKGIIEGKKVERKKDFNELRKGYNSFIGEKDKSDLTKFYAKTQKGSWRYLEDEKNYEIAQSVDFYIGEGYEEIRKDLSSGGEKYKKMSGEISKFIEDNKITENVSLNRRVDFTKAGGLKAKALFEGLNEGDIYTDKSFASASLEELDHFGDFNIEILAKKGSPVANLNNPGEYEFLIDKGTKFKVLGKTENGIIVEIV